MPEIESIDIDYLESKIQSILDRNHSESAKKVIKRFPSETNPERLNFACPICGDSQKKSWNKRGNLFTDTLYYICFNCDERMSFIKLCELFDEKIQIEDKIKMYNYVDAHVKFSKSNNQYILDSLDKLININDFIEYFNNRKNSWLADISPVKPGSNVYNYLKNERFITDFDDILQGNYQVIKDNEVKYKINVMISLNKSADKLIGIQLRNLEKDKNKRFYKIVEFNEIYDYMNPANPLDEMEAISYNKLSHFYNILNVNFDQPVTVFEGFLDSKFYPNSIGMVGARNDNLLLSFLLLSNDDLQIQFFYDNDLTGIKKATEMLAKGYPVFLWQLLFKKIIEKNKKQGVEKLKNIIDLNDLAISAKNPNVYSALKLDTFFSKDQFDVRYLPKLIYDKYEKRWKFKS